MLSPISDSSIALIEQSTIKAHDGSDSSASRLLLNFARGPRPADGPTLVRGV